MLFKQLLTILTLFIPFVARYTKIDIFLPAWKIAASLSTKKDIGTSHSKYFIVTRYMECLRK